MYNYFPYWILAQNNIFNAQSPYLLKKYLKPLIDDRKHTVGVFQQASAMIPSVIFGTLIILPIMHTSILLFNSIKKIIENSINLVVCLFLNIFRMQYEKIERENNITRMYLLIDPILMNLNVLDMYWVPRAVVTKHHKLNNLENQGVGSVGSSCRLWESAPCSSTTFWWSPALLGVPLACRRITPMCASTFILRGILPYVSISLLFLKDPNHIKDPHQYALTLV